MKRANLTFVMGVLVSISVITYGLLAEVGAFSLKVFMHPTALAIVVGGSLGCALMSMPVKLLGRVIARTYYAVRYPKDDFLVTIRAVMQVSIGLSKDPFYLETAQGQIQNVMLQDGLQLMNMGFKSDDIRRFLEVRREQNEQGLNQCAILYFGLAKLGPALGLVGTLIGLVILLYYHMGAGDVQKIGGSMGVALTATLYGVGLANLVFGPLSEHMTLVAEQSFLLDTLVIEGVIFIKEKRQPVYMIQALKSYLPREDFQALETIMQETMEATKATKSTGSDQTQTQKRAA